MSGISQAIVLAAGRGSRLGPGGDARPKCLTPLAGQPLLRWTLNGLAACGIHRTLVVGGWQHEALAGWGSERIVNPDWASTNAVASLRLAGDWLLREPTLVVYGDGAYGATALSDALRSNDGDIVVPVDTLWLELWSRRFADPLQDAETLARRDGRVLRIGQKPRDLSEVDAQFMGLVRWTPAGWAATETWLASRPPAPKLDMTSLLSGLIQAGLPVHATEVAGGWVEIDSQQDLDAVELALDQPDFQHDFRR